MPLCHCVLSQHRFYVGSLNQVESVPDRRFGAIGWVERELASDGCTLDGEGVDEEAAADLNDDSAGAAARRRQLSSTAGDITSTMNSTNHSSHDSSFEGELMCLVTTIWTRYLTSVYWALMTVSTVGYGDIVAKTVNDHIYTQVYI